MMISQKVEIVVFDNSNSSSYEAKNVNFGLFTSPSHISHEPQHIHEKNLLCTVGGHQ